MKKLFFLLSWCMVASLHAQRVGIGTTSPQLKLEVRDTLSPLVARFSSGPLQSAIRFGSGSTDFLELGHIQGGGYVNMMTGGDFDVRMSGMTRLKLQYPSGRLGVGSIGPSAMLHVQDDFDPDLGLFQNYADQAHIRVSNAGTQTEMGSDGSMGYVGTSSDRDFSIRTDALPRITVKHSSGLVGIGTTAPENLLHVAASTGFVDLARFQSNGGYGQILVSNGSITTDLGADNSKGYVGTNSNHNFNIRAGGDDIIYLKEGSKYVGIGTPTPYCRLTVSSDELNTETAAFLNTAGNASLFLSNMQQSIRVFAEPTLCSIGSTSPTDFAIKSNNQNRMYIQNSTGHIGIGTGAPNFRLHVVQQNPNVEVARFQSNGGYATILVGNGTAFSSLGQSATQGWVGSVSPQDFSIKTGNTDRMFIQQSTGYVGIGTSSPMQQLHVNGNALITGNQMVDGGIGINTPNTLAPLQLFDEGSGSILAFLEGDGGIRQVMVTNGIHSATLGSSVDYSFTGSESGSDFAIQTGGLNRIRIKSNSGWVGLGTDTPVVPFQVKAPANELISAKFGNNEMNNRIQVASSLGTAALGVMPGSAFVGSDSIHDFSLTTAGIVRMMIKEANGNIGIGTVNPTGRLTLRPDNSENVLQFQNSLGTNTWQWKAAIGDLSLVQSSSNVTRIKIEEEGQMGIGTAQPTTTLHVGGTFKVDQQSTFTGNVIINGAATFNTDVNITGALTVAGIAQNASSAATLVNNFTNQGSPFGPASYYLDKEKRVHLSGMIVIPTGGSGTMFTLPAGFRPQFQCAFAILKTSGGTARIDISTNGNVILEPGNSGLISLEGISFRAYP